MRKLIALTLLSPVMLFMAVDLGAPVMAGVWAMLITWVVFVCVFGMWLFDVLPSQAAVVRFLFNITYAPPGQISTVNGFAIATLAGAGIAALALAY